MFTGQHTYTHVFKLWKTVDLERAGGRRQQQEYPGGGVVGLVVLVTMIAVLATGYATAATLVGPSRSRTITLTSDNRRVVVVNRDSNSVSIIQVRNTPGADSFAKLAEVEVEREPRYVALHPDDSVAYVTNTVSGSVSVIALTGPQAFTVVDRIPLGPTNTEPRGIAVTPNGTRLYVANHTGGTVSVIDTATRTVIATITASGLINPTAIAITNDGDASDQDERVFITDFFAKLFPNGPGEGFDDGKRGAVFTFPVNNPNNVQRININPLNNSGFTADRTLFCPDGNPNPHDPIFCPDVNAPITSSKITQDPQGAHPNQLQSLLIRNLFLYVPSIGAAPELPVRFNVNVQGLVNVVNTTTLTDDAARRTNLNAQVAAEPPGGGLNRTFLNDLVDIDATLGGAPTFLLVSRGGDYVIEARVGLDGKLDIDAPDHVARYQTGHIPTGVVVSTDSRRAYTNNEVGMSVTAIDLLNRTVIQRNIPSSTPPEPGLYAHAVLVGKLAFFTALGIPNNDIFDTPIRNIPTVANRGKASRDAWSSCASCHPDGLSDGVTWIFDTGPRNTLPMDAFFAKDNPDNQRISN
jgi:YVTN family beta-propeller protein